MSERTQTVPLIHSYAPIAEGPKERNFEAERQADRISQPDMLREYFNGGKYEDLEQAQAFGFPKATAFRTVGWTGAREWIYSRAAINAWREQFLTVAKRLKK